MKRVLVFFCVAFVMAAAAFADGQVRLGLEVAKDFDYRPDFAAVTNSFSSPGSYMAGLFWEVIFDHLGLAGNYMVSYDSTDAAILPDFTANLGWQGDLLLTFHLFGGGAFLDPFAEMGVGCAGSVNLGAVNYTELVIQALGIYPTFNLGLAIDLSGFLVGAKVGYRLSSIDIPVTGFQTLSAVAPFQVTLFGGVALGGH